MRGPTPQSFGVRSRSYRFSRSPDSAATIDSGHAMQSPVRRSRTPVTLAGKQQPPPQSAIVRSYVIACPPTRVIESKPPPRLICSASGQPDYDGRQANAFAQAPHVVYPDCTQMIAALAARCNEWHAIRDPIRDPTTTVQKGERHQRPTR